MKFLVCVDLQKPATNKFIVFLGLDAFRRRKKGSSSAYSQDKAFVPYTNPGTLVSISVYV
jgi:hypothetical protein